MYKQGKIKIEKLTEEEKATLKSVTSARNLHKRTIKRYLKNNEIVSKEVLKELKFKDIQEIYKNELETLKEIKIEDLTKDELKEYNAKIKATNLIEELRRDFCKLNRKKLNEAMTRENVAFMENFQLNYSEFYTLCCYVVTKSIKTLIARGNGIAIELYNYKDIATLNDLRQEVATYYLENNFTNSDFLEIVKGENEDKELLKIFLNGFKIVSKYLYNLKQRNYKEFYIENFNYETDNEETNKANYIRFKSASKFLATQLEIENTNYNLATYKLNGKEIKSSKDKTTLLNDLHLTKNELEILILKAKGYTNKQISEFKNVSVKAIELTIYRLRKKHNCTFKNNKTKHQEKQQKKDTKEELEELPLKKYHNDKLLNERLEIFNSKATTCYYNTFIRAI